MPFINKNRPIILNMTPLGKDKETFQPYIESLFTCKTVPTVPGQLQAQSSASDTGNNASKSVKGQE